MGLFLKEKMPVFTKEDIGNHKKLIDLIQWFVKNDQFVAAIKNRSCNVIFSEGYKPIITQTTNPENFSKDISSLGEWFFIQLTIDLNILKNIGQNEFKKFIDALGDITNESLIISGNIAVKYEMNMEKFIYDEEIMKILNGDEREIFKYNFLIDSVISAEMRILGWLYHEWFGEWYKTSEISE